MKYCIVFTVLTFLVWLYYQLQGRIGKQQQMEWAEYVAAHPEYFKQKDEQQSDIRKKQQTRGEDSIDYIV